MSYRTLDHATDAIIEVTADNLENAFKIAGMSVIETILDVSRVSEIEKKSIQVEGKDLKYLLYNWLEEIIILTITDGFAGRTISLTISNEDGYKINADIFGEIIDLKKHEFKVEIKSPTFHDMRIEQKDNVVLRYLLDL